MQDFQPVEGQRRLRISGGQWIRLAALVFLPAHRRCSRILPADVAGGGLYKRRASSNDTFMVADG